MSRFIPSGLGWQRDLPDPRDYTSDHPVVSALLGELPNDDLALPSRIDLRKDEDGIYFSPTEDQGRLNASSAFACLALVEYFERRILGHTFDGSRRFLYEMSRKISRAGGNTGVGIRTTLKALRRYGAPPEEMCPYFDQHPISPPTDASLLGYSRELEGIVYFRLDPSGQSGTDALAVLRLFLSARFPVAFGFPVPRSVTQDAVIPFRPTLDSYHGGQSVLAVGYDDQRILGQQGALLIRNSWGDAWGESGYGWLPYTYITGRQTADMWTIVSSKWSVPAAHGAGR